MQQIIFARDRRRKKARIRAALLLIALSLISVGFLLVLKNQNLITPPQAEIVWVLDGQDDSPEEIEGSLIDEDISLIGTIQHDLEQLVDLADEQPEEDSQATSYHDELTEQDDEELTDEENTQVAQKPSVLKSDTLSQEAKQTFDRLLDVAGQALRIQSQFSYTVTRGDKLNDVLSQSGLGVSAARSLIRAFPELAKLESGQQFYWILDKNGDLEHINWLVSEKEERIYERRDNGKFAMRKIEKKGEWRQDVVKGTLNGSFSASLKKVGLSDRQINQLAAGLQSQIATQKLKNGDRFAILVKREYINGKVTDLGNVEGIHIVSAKKSYYAIQAANGRYYSLHGESINKGFARQPLLFNARVSSQFNPRRIHPISRRVIPHKGTDFAVPIGTPIVAPADGVVEHIAYQARGAGRYIKIRHGHITTVYMHLSKSLVKVGQSVKKGERIALSGNTGGSTGPHLHYEVHINGQPVNPMTVKLPSSGGGMSDKERKNFLARAKTIQAKLKL